MPTVRQLRNPALGVGWLAADLEWPPSTEATWLCPWSLTLQQAVAGTLS